MVGRWLTLLVVIANTGCLIGPRAGSFRPARGPQGVRAVLTVSAPCSPVNGEVLAVDPNGLLLLTDSTNAHWLGPRVTRVPSQVVTRGDFDQMRGDAHIERGYFPSGQGQVQVRRVSRYPQGISREVLAALLRAYGQIRPDTICP